MATTFTHKVGVLYSSDAGTLTNTTETFTGDGETGYRGTVPGPTTNMEIDIVAPVAKIRSFVMLAKTVALTVKTNSSSAPDNTIALAAGKQLVWNTNHLEANPLTVDVTKLYVTNAGAATDFVVSILLDATPVAIDPA